MKKILMLFLVLVSTCLFGCNKSVEVSGSINPYSRDTSSGTREGFFSAIGASNAKSSDSYLVDTTSIVDTNGDMINKVAGDKNAIGYISLTSLAKAEGVVGLSYDGVEATEDNVLNDTYNMSRWFSYISIDDTKDDNKSKLIKEFNNFINSRDGKLVLLDSGVIVEVTGDRYTPGSICSSKGVSETIYIGGSTSVEFASKKVTSILSSKCGNFKVQHNHTGSSDSSKVYKDGSLDIGFSSSGRRSDWSSDLAKLKNVYVNDLGQDAIVAIVNKENTLRNITMLQLQEIYVKHDATKDGVAIAPNKKNVFKWEDVK